MSKLVKTLSLVLCLVLVLGSVAYAAEMRYKLMEVTYMDINLVVDGVPVVPKTVDGNIVEPFVYEGTTYLPVRAVGEALGKQVSWDGSTKTVYVGAKPGDVTYLLDVCPPYETHNYEAPEVLKMFGNSYTKAFQLRLDGYAYFNLNGEYNYLDFDLGHVDGTNVGSGTIKIYLDGVLSYTLDAETDMMLTHYSIPLNGALQLKIVPESGYTFAKYGFANAILS